MKAILPPGLTLFRTSFNEPSFVRIAGGRANMLCGLVTEDLPAAEVFRLVAEDCLQLNFGVHIGLSSSPAVHTGRATLREDRGRLSASILIPLSAFAGASSCMLNLVFAYEDIGRFDEWGFPGDWVVASLPRSDVFETYFASFNLERR